MTSGPTPESASADAMPARSDGSTDHAPEAVDGLDLTVADLRRKLETLPVIEQSKGVLISYYGICPEVAFVLLRRWSSQNNQKLRDISRLIVAAASEGHHNQEALRSLVERLDN